MLGFEIVAYLSDARGILLQLLREVHSGNFDNADKAIKDADENLAKAHNAQIQLLAQEAGDEDLELDFIFIHGQDRLITTLLLRDLVTNFTELYKNR